MSEVARLEGVVSLVGVNQAMQGLGQFGRKVDETQSKLGGVEKSTRSMSQRLSGVGRELTTKVSLPLLGVGLAAGKAGMEFDAQMSKVAAKSGATADQIKRLREQALELGAKTSFSAKQAAQGMEELAAAGMKTDDILAAMPGLLDAAAASGEGVGEVSAIVANSLAQFNLSASESTRIADVLAKASNETQGSIASMGEAMKYAGTVSSQMGFDLEQTAGMVSMMVKAGIEGGQAGTALRMGLMRLAKVPAAPALEKLQDISPKLAAIWKSAQPVPEKLRAMSSEMRKMDGTNRVAAAGLIFGTEASSGMVEVLKKGPAEIDKWTRSMRNSGGEAERMGRVMRDNLKGDVEALGGSLETAFIGLFDQANGPLRDVTSSLTGMVNAFSALSPAVQQSVVGFGALALVTGPALMAFGSMATGATAAIGGVTALGSGMANLAMRVGNVAPVMASLSLAMAANPLLTGAIAIGGLIAAGVAIATMGDESRDLDQQATEAAAAVQALTDASSALAGLELSTRETATNAAQARRDAARATQAHRDAVEQYGAKSQEAKDAALQEQQALLRLERATLSAKEARDAFNKKVMDAKKGVADNIRAIREEKETREELREQIDWFVERYGSLEGAQKRAGGEMKKLNREIRQSTERSNEAKEALRNSAGALEQLAPKSRVAKDALRQVREALGQIPSNKTINLQVNAKVAVQRAWDIGRNILNSATGGRVRGPGTATSDSIPAMLSNGEYVVRASSVAKYGDEFMDALNEGRVSAFARGGRARRRRRTAAQIQTGISRADARVAAAEGTPQISDDLRELNALAAQYAAEVRRLEAVVRSKAFAKKKPDEKQSIFGDLASARRSRQSTLDRRKSLLEQAAADRQAASDQRGAEWREAENLRREALGLESLEEEERRNKLNAIRRANGLPELGVQAAGALDAQEPDLAAQLAQAQKRAADAQANLALQSTQMGVLGGAGDIGAGGYANAYLAARGGTPQVIYNINALSGYDTAIQSAMAQASNGGNASGGNADVMYSGRG